jgi:hypothetical protein
VNERVQRRQHHPSSMMIIDSFRRFSVVSPSHLGNPLALLALVFVPFRGILAVIVDI